ncbi:hypothetical protein [Salisediminibacterium selenitireducens]|uniref:GAF domain-containing protein n=1 Tax=Bacillus selenitireducens (strain ATCC 700615 / DSM 15326 / MLS10) TaxID=439292 RepID=D6XZD7_BACIE|nr:hypothetical protein [Salisediminibacterium selenitireducens]ADH98311.1 hypothetical protein Bsel_0782 [[Bacillus] selenitireducens MLS10]
MKDWAKKTINSISIVFKKWKTNWGNFIVILIPLFLALLDFYDIDLGLFWLIIVGLIFIIGWFQNINKVQDIEEYEKIIKDYGEQKERLEFQLEHLNSSIESYPERIIKFIAKELNHDFSDRLTIYRFDKKTEEFIPLGRYSKNNEIKKIGRSKYPKNKGYIHKAWTQGEFFIESLPDFETDPKAYVDFMHRDSNLEKKVIRELTMKSRSYYFKTLSNKDDESIAIIVFESLDAGFKCSKNDMENLIYASLGELLVESIDRNLIKERRGA